MGSIIGSMVSVQMDRPLGSVHPKHADLVYPVNYGFVPGVMSPDGEYQDAYVLGPTVPLSRFTGIVTAILVREDDIETKWIVEEPLAPRLTDEEILSLVGFQERFFKTKITRQDV